MIGIICNYHQQKMFDNILRPSLENQTIKFNQFIINNTDNNLFSSASKALNYGAKQIKECNYYVFLHQDIELPYDFCRQVEAIMNTCKLDIAGVIGKTAEGNLIGEITSCGELYGVRTGTVAEAQILDECLIIISKELFDKLKFDEINFDGWHCYAADYCLSAKSRGIKTWILPIHVYHRSLATNTNGINKYRTALLKKHGKLFPLIHLTTGTISRKNMILFSLYPIYKKIVPSWINRLKKELNDCESVLDLGCGYNSPLQYCKNIKNSLGVDGFKPYIIESKKKGIHTSYIKCDLQYFNTTEKFDAILLSEVIEHMSKEEVFILLKKLDKIATKKIIITTPNGYIPQDGYDDNKYQNHLSGFDTNYLLKHGFRVWGMNGWKNLKGYKGNIKYKPELLFTAISDFSQYITNYIPESSFQLFAVKTTREYENAKTKKLI